MNWHSQAGQDKWVVDMLGESAGFFVDVGAHDGVVHSNTYALERYFGWDGLCIEPEPAAYDVLRRNRSSTCVRAAASDLDGVCLFDGMRVITAGGSPIECFTLTSLLDELDDPPTVIDYLSIDTEGHDLNVLNGMDFDRWTVRLITIEHNEYLEGPARKLAILDYMMARGFECVALDVVADGYGCYESWYRRRDH